MDILYVSLGSTAGLRAADAELVASLRRAGASVVVASARPRRDVRTLALTDLAWALAARAAARDALRARSPRAVVYGTVTAALLGPVPGAIRYDAPAAANRPGRHGVWQRPRERAVIARAPLRARPGPGGPRGSPGRGPSRGGPGSPPPPRPARTPRCRWRVRWTRAWSPRTWRGRCAARSTTRRPATPSARARRSRRSGA